MRENELAKSLGKKLFIIFLDLTRITANNPVFKVHDN